ncbi:MAG: hypothetical protein V4709_10865 [Pseudomonadota bacterium]
MRRLVLLPLLLSVLIACGKPEPQAPPQPTEATKASVQTPAPVVEYLAALAAVEKSKAPISLEALFDRAEGAQAALMSITGEVAVLERYSAAEFAALQAQLRGLTLHRELDIYAQPEPPFFLALAKAHGLPSDVAFFTQYAATWGPDLVPVYLKLRPQPTPCVRFGEGRIAPLYASWKAFATQHPTAYAGHSAQMLADLEEALALGTCACDGLESVRAEQAAFLKQFPDAAKAAEITARREQLARDPDVLPVNCR